MDPSLNNHMWVDYNDNVHIHLKKHKTAKSIGPRNVQLNAAQSKYALQSLTTNMPKGRARGSTRFRKFYVQHKDAPIKNMTRVINTLKSGTGGAADVRLYGCNTYRRNMADEMISKRLEADMVLFADTCTRITEATKELYMVAVSMGSSGGVLLTEYRKSGKIKWTVDSKAAIQLLLQRAHGGINYEEPNDE
jgi:hypothetical protein